MITLTSTGAPRHTRHRIQHYYDAPKMVNAQMTALRLHTAITFVPTLPCKVRGTGRGKALELTLRSRRIFFLISDCAVK